MPKPKPLSKQDILNAMDKTSSNRAAARYLHVSFNHYKKFAKLYKNNKGIDLWEAHKNQAGQGIPKLLRNSGTEVGIFDIVNGHIDPSSFTPERIKQKMISEGLLEEKCSQCGFQERRVIDYKTPLVLNFKDGNKRNYTLENVSLMCYNCYFLFVGDPLSQQQLKAVEDYVPTKVKEPKWQLNDYHYKRLKELGLEGEEEKEINKLISRNEDT